MDDYEFTFDDPGTNLTEDNSKDIFEWYEKSIREEKIIDGQVYERHSCNENKNYYRYEFRPIPEGYILGNEYAGGEIFDFVLGKIQLLPEKIFRLTKPVMVCERIEYTEDEVLASRNFESPFGYGIKYEYEIKVKDGWKKADDLYEFHINPKDYSDTFEIENYEYQLEANGGQRYLEKMIEQEIISLYEIDLFFK